MIKLMCFLSRRPELAPEAFHAHWRDTHGPLFAETPELRRHLVRYERNHRLEADYARARTANESSDGGRDGVAVQWFASWDAFAAMQAEPAYRERVAPDEDRFIDRAKTRWIVADDEDWVYDDTAGRADAEAKLLSIFRRHPDLSRDAFHAHWTTHHGGLYRDVPELRRDVVSYAQNHRAQRDEARDPQAGDGVTEQWFRTLDDFVASLREPKTIELVRPDVAYLLDAPSIEFVMSAPAEVVVG